MKSWRANGPRFFWLSPGTPESYYGELMNKGRILIVDDQEEIIHSLRAILLDEGLEVIAARDGQEALHVVQNESPDIVFLDIWIPGIDGMQTLKAIKKIAPGCSVIMMSGHGTIETAVKAIKLGATDYLEKPLNLEDVLHLVHAAVSSRRQAAKSVDQSSILSRPLIGISDKTEHLRRGVESAAAELGPILLVGDKGTGKEFIARMIHQAQGKGRHTLVTVRCPDLTENNLEDELIGRDNGSGRSRSGKLAQAQGGSLLLTRVDRLPPSLGSKLAQIIKGHAEEEERAGIPQGKRTRVLSTSVSDPGTLIRHEGFDEVVATTLAHRVIRIPTLAERAEDIPLFVKHFLAEASEEFDRNITGVDDSAMERLLSYSWPGNVKELKIVIEHVVMTAPGPIITAGDLLIPGESKSRGTDDIGLETVSPADGSTRWDVPPETGHATHGQETRSRVRPQKTLRGRAVMYGQGLHSGNKTGLTLSPLPPSAGILFGHITSGGTVPAVLHNVESTDFSTSLRSNGSLARTIEHLMAVFHIYGLTNVLVKISGEVPIMDGSALEFCRLVESAEIITQDETIEEIRISEPLELPLPEGSPKSMRVEPSDQLEVEYFLDYPPPVGKMHMVFACNGPEHFKEQIAPARTFGFVKDMRMMDQMGLAGGGRLSNVVLLDEEKVVNPPLRFSDEFVRHKILDIIGDFYLLGRPFVGKIIARQTGHTENIAMMKMINERLKIL